MSLNVLGARLLCFGLLSLGFVASSAADDLASRANRAYADGDFDLAAQLFTDAAACDRLDTGLLYNGACSAALAGQMDLAFDLLEQAVGAGYSNVAHLESDPDLASLRTDPRWGPVVDRVRSAQERLTSFWDSDAFGPTSETIGVDLRVAGLSKLWSEAKYNFANFDLVPDLDFDRLYLETLPRVRAAESGAEYYRVLAEFIASLRDGHSNVYPPREIADQLLARPALRTRLIGEKVLVIEVYDQELARSGLLVGHEIVEIDGVPALEYGAQQIQSWQAASTRQDLESRTFERNLLAGSAGSSVALGLSDAEGGRQTMAVRRLPRRERAKTVPKLPGFAMQELPENRLLIELNSFNDPSAYEEFLARFDEISQAEGLILDLRNNGGGNSGWGWRILAMLTPDTVPTSAWDTRLYRPAFRAWGRGEARHRSPPGQWSADPDHHYSGSVVVLAGPRTYSAAEDFLVSFDSLGRGLIVGQPTGGSTGQPLTISLPGGGTARICTKRDRYPDGREFVGVGVLPDVLVVPTVEDFRAGRDRALEEAIEVSKRQGDRNLEVGDSYK